MRRAAGLGCLVALLIPGSVVAARPAGPAVAPPANDDCLVCHTDPSLKRANGTAVLIDVKQFEGSNHALLACVDCHLDLATLSDFPHAERLARVECGTCHDEALAKYARGVHAAARLAGQSLSATCADCHGTHGIQSADKASSSIHHLNLPRTCARCHGNPDIVRRAGIQMAAAVSEYRDSIHGRALERSGLVVAPSCVDCHGSHDIERSAVPTSLVFRTNVPATCGRCHAGIVERYRQGIHAAALARGDPRAPVCSDCHTAHSIQRADTEAWRLGVATECGTCHASVVASFRRTFHGKLTELGSARAATCADCHGAHDILPASDPTSTVSPAHLVQTCGRCHTGANPRFVQFDPHPNPYDYRRSAVLWWINRFYTVLIAGCFGFFGLHSLLWFRRERADARGRQTAAADAAKGIDD